MTFQFSFLRPMTLKIHKCNVHFIRFKQIYCEPSFELHDFEFCFSYPFWVNSKDSETGITYEESLLIFLVTFSNTIFLEHDKSLNWFIFQISKIYFLLNFTCYYPLKMDSHIGYLKILCRRRCLDKLVFFSRIWMTPPPPPPSFRHF